MNITQGRAALVVLMGLFSGQALSGGGNNTASNEFAGTALTLTSLPVSSVAPSDAAGTKTFVNYTVKLESLTTAGSPANFFLSLTMLPATPVSNFVIAFNDVPPQSTVAPPNCTVSNSSIGCTFSKFYKSDSYTITFRAEAPTSAQGNSMTLQAYRGNQLPESGNSRTDTLVLPVTATSGASFVPANTAVTVRTSPGEPTTANPLIGIITSPKLPYDYTLYTAVKGSRGGTDFNATATAGIFLNLTDGGPYLARNTKDSTYAIEVEAQTMIGQPIEVLPGNPFIIESLSDVTTVAPLQLPPTFLLPSGTPTIAFFYNGLGGELRAEADNCGYDTAPAPCVLDRAVFANGDLSIKYRKASTGSEGAPSLTLYDLLFGTEAFAQISPKIRTR